MRSNQLSYPAKREVLKCCSFRLASAKVRHFLGLQKKSQRKKGKNRVCLSVLLYKLTKKRFLDTPESHFSSKSGTFAHILWRQIGVLFRQKSLVFAIFSASRLAQCLDLAAWKPASRSLLLQPLLHDRPHHHPWPHGIGQNGLCRCPRPSSRR